MKYTQEQLLQIITETDPSVKGKRLKDCKQLVCAGRLGRKDGSHKQWTVHYVRINDVAKPVVCTDGIIL